MERMYSRRIFLKNMTYSIIASRLDLLPETAPLEANTSRIVRVHDANASRPWDYRPSSPWNHTAEHTSPEEMKHGKFRKDRYFDFINEDVVSSMFQRGIKELTGTSSSKEAWRILLTRYRIGEKITIKINLN